MLKIYNMTISQMVDRGWTIINDTKTDRPTAIRSVIPDWNDLTWAQRTYYCGKYRFSQTGVLEIGLSELRNATEKVIMNFSRNLLQDKYVTPDGSLIGSNERLKRILEQSRVELECSKYDDTALVHIGPDGTAIYTNEVGWGPPYHWLDDKFYFELDDYHTCYWEIGPNWIPEAPCWACPECNGF